MKEGRTRTKTDHWLVLPSNLQKKGVQIRKIRSMPVWLIIAVIALMSLKMTQNPNSEDIIKALAASVFALICSFIAWRLTVRRAISLTHEVHLWAVENEKNHKPWTDQPADASSIYASWIPDTKGRLKAAGRIIAGKGIK